MRGAATTVASIGVLLVACAAPTPPAPTSPPTAPPESAPPTAPAGSAGAALSTAVVPTEPPPPTSTPVGSRALVEASLASLAKTLHPYPDGASYTQAWVDAAILIWGAGDGGGALLAYDWDTLDYRPAMARAMPTVSSDGKTYTFSLRDDLKWSDGSPITVDDFLFAYDNASREDSHYAQLDLVQDIASFRAPDRSTIEVMLKTPKPRDVALGTANIITPVPKKVWEGKSWTDASANPEILKPSVVLGPFRVQDFKAAEHAVFTALDTYYVGKPHVPQVELLASQQPSGAYEALKSGRANWVHALPPAQYQEAKANPDLVVQEWTPANATYRAIEFNLNRPFLSDKRVREALARAVNRADMLNVAEQGLGIPQYTFVQPTNQKWVTDAVERYDFDLDRAKQLLQEAGYALQDGQLVGKDGQPVTLQVLYPTSSSPRARLATYLQQQYQQLGIQLELKGLDFNAYTDQVQNRKDFDLSLAAYGGGALDPDLGPKAQLVSTGQQNVTGYANPQVDELFRQASNELDQARRKQLYDQIQQLVNADLPSHYLYAIKAIDVFSKKVQGVVPHRGDRLDYNDSLLGWSVVD